MAAKNKDKKEIQFEQPSDILLLVNRYLMVIIGLIILIILVSGYFFLLKPKIDSINVSETRTTVTEERRLGNEHLLTRIKELEAEYYDIINNRQEDLDMLRKMVPADSQIAEIFLMSDLLAKKYGFQLTTIDISDNEPVREKPKPVVTEDFSEDNIPADSASGTAPPETNTIESLLAISGIKTATVKFAVVREVVDDSPVLGVEIYDDFKDYISDLENNIRLMDIQAIIFDSIDAEPGSNGSRTYTFNLDLITYYR